MSKEKQTQDALLEAIDIAVENKLKKLGFNYYVDGVIEGKNIDNTYNVLINGEIYNNVPSKNNFEYSVNDVVQVLIKNGNWNKKFIDDKKNHNEIPQNILNLEQDISNIEQNYFCLSQRIRIPAGADVNDYKTAGNYIIDNYTDARKIKNIPEGSQGFLTVYDYDNSGFKLRQEYTTLLGNGIYVRYILSNDNGLTWIYGGWNKILDKSDLPNELPDALAYTSVKDALLDLVYPVGSIYMSVNNVSPQNFLGGTWEAWGSGKVPVGVNTSETEFNEVEKTGGAKTHTLTTAQTPKHTHTLTPSGSISTKSLTGEFWNMATQSLSTGMSANGIFTAKIHDDKAPYPSNLSAVAGNNDAVSINASHNHTFTGTQGTTSESGGGSAHNNLQPYITCYMWKRVQ